MVFNVKPFTSKSIGNASISICKTVSVFLLFKDVTDVILAPAMQQKSIQTAVSRSHLCVDSGIQKTWL